MYLNVTTAKPVTLSFHKIGYAKNVCRLCNVAEITKYKYFIKTLLPLNTLSQIVIKYVTLKMLLKVCYFAQV